LIRIIERSNTSGDIIVLAATFLNKETHEPPFKAESHEELRARQIVQETML
jgi:hypothetical protein